MSIQNEHVLKEQEGSGDWPKIVLFGDSMTRYATNLNAGPFYPMLQHEVGDYFDVDLRGFSGYTTRQAVELLPILFPPRYLKKVKIFVEFFGHNDSWSNYPLTTAAEEFEDNNRKIFQYLLDNGLEKDKIITITPAWFNPACAQKMAEEMHLYDLSKSFDKNLDVAKKYNDIKINVAQEFGITCIDFFMATLNNEVSLEEFFYDGLHLSRRGAEILFKDHLMPIVEHKIQSMYGKRLNELRHFAPIFEMQPIRAWMDVDKFLETAKTIDS